jgi:hypothetical protein
VPATTTDYRRKATNPGKNESHCTCNLHVSQLHDVGHAAQARLRTIKWIATTALTVAIIATPIAIAWVHTLVRHSIAQAGG